MENLEVTAPEITEISPVFPGRSVELDKLYSALSKFQGEIQEPVNNCYNDHLHYWYPDLGACWKAIRKPLVDNDLLLTQFTIPSKDDYIIRLVTKIAHVSGQFESGVMDGRVQELAVVIENGETVKGEYNRPLKEGQDSHSNAAKAITISYLKRLALCMVTGLSTDDIAPSAADEIIKRKKDAQPAAGGQRRQGGNQRNQTGNGQRPGSNRENQIAGIKKAVELAELNSETLLKLFTQYGVKNIDQLPDQELSAFSKGIISAKRFQEKTLAAEKEQAEGVTP